MNSGSWYWPDVSELDGAKDATQVGMWCAVAVAGFTVISVFLPFVFFIGVPKGVPVTLADGVVFAAIAYGFRAIRDSPRQRDSFCFCWRRFMPTS